jgi:hypothetical protein
MIHSMASIRLDVNKGISNTTNFTNEPTPVDTSTASVNVVYRHSGGA